MNCPYARNNIGGTSRRQSVRDGKIRSVQTGMKIIEWEWLERAFSQLNMINPSGSFRLPEGFLKPSEVPLRLRGCTVSNVMPPNSVDGMIKMTHFSVDFLLCNR